VHMYHANATQCYIRDLSLGWDTEGQVSFLNSTTTLLIHKQGEEDLLDEIIFLLYSFSLYLLRTMWYVTCGASFCWLPHRLFLCPRHFLQSDSQIQSLDHTQVHPVSMADDGNVRFHLETLMSYFYSFSVLVILNAKD
jgi:hypothetical protein